ncbi:hypothetical protein HYS47_03215 [Candidatus Woesearchaeota archaeon]|nr:hypothetical protein [Candidatus Woesearchaeota archaeon]
MKRSTTLLLALGAEALAAYLLLRHEPFFSDKSVPDKTVKQGGIEQIIGLEEDGEAKNQNPTTTAKKQDSLKKEERPADENMEQDPGTPTPPNLYQVWKNPLERILKADVRLLYDDYDYSLRRTGDWYITEADNTITIHQVKDDQQPPYTDKFLLEIIEEDDGSYTAKGEGIAIDEDASAPYIAVNGTQQDVQDKLPHLIEWQQSFERVLQRSRDIQNNPNLSREDKMYFIYTAYRDGFQSLQQTGITHGILNPATAGVLDSTIDLMRKSWEEQRYGE